MLPTLIIKFVYIYISVGLTANVKGTQLTLTDIEKPGEEESTFHNYNQQLLIKR